MKQHPPYLKITTTDKFVLFTVIIFIVAAYYYFWFAKSAYPEYAKQNATHAKIFIGKKLHSNHRLNINRILNIRGKIGHSLIEIKQGKIRFKKSPCTNQYCVLAGWRSLNKSLIACLPNRIAIELTSQTPYFDAINY